MLGWKNTFLLQSVLVFFFPSEGPQILISFERAFNHFRCIFFILNWSFLFSLTSWRPLPGVFLLNFSCIIDLQVYSTGYTGDDTLGSLRSRTAGRLRTAEWGKMSRKIGNAQSPATFFRHSAVLSLQQFQPFCCVSSLWWIVLVHVLQTWAVWARQRELPLTTARAVQIPKYG